MTIVSQTTWYQQTASAGQTEFPSIPFVFELAENVKVNVAGVDLTSDQYTVVGAGLDPAPQTRSVTLVTPASAGDVVTIYLDGPYDRTTDFTIAGNFSAVNVNTEFDRIFLKLQQLDTQLNELGLVYDFDTDKTDGASINKLEKLPANSGSGIPVWTTNSEGDLIAGTLEEESGCSTLRSELANEQSGTDGARLVGYYNPTSSTEETVKDTLDDLNSKVIGNIFSTGMVLPFFGDNAPAGWLAMDGGTIGNALSNATNFKDALAEDLFKQLWTYTSTNDGWLPLYDSTGAQVTRGASADADWTANRAISLPLSQGRTLTNLDAQTISIKFTDSYPGDVNTLTLSFTGAGQTAEQLFPSGTLVTLTTDGSLPGGLATGTNYYVRTTGTTTLVLYSTPGDYTADTNRIALTSTSASNNFITWTLPSHSPCEYEGNASRIMRIEQMPGHTHTYTEMTGSRNMEGNHTPITDTSTPNQQTGSAGGNAVFSVQNPTLWCNYIIKY